jgi:hypothetical protein
MQWSVKLRDYLSIESTVQIGHTVFNNIALPFLVVLGFELKALSLQAGTLLLELGPRPLCICYFSNRVSPLCPGWPGHDTPIYTF